LYKNAGKLRGILGVGIGIAIGFDPDSDTDPDPDGSDSGGIFRIEAMEEAAIAEGTPAGASARTPLCILRLRVSFSCRDHWCPAAFALSFCFLHRLNRSGGLRDLETYRGTD
jgi:hypothetical protein